MIILKGNSVTTEIGTIIHCELVYKPFLESNLSVGIKTHKIFILLDLITLPGTYPQEIIRDIDTDLYTMNS